MRFASLASGSRGNALLIEHKQTLVMIDCGLTLKAAEERFREIGREPRDVTALLVTHEHADHVRGVAAFARRYGTDVWMTAGTAVGSAARRLSKLRTFNCARALEIGDMRIEPFTVPHDAREPAQFVLQANKRRLGLLSDTGHVTRHVRDHLAHCDALAVEFNHDLDSLWSGDYPAAVKQRISSPLGHLDNTQAGRLVRDIAHADLQWVIALHLSEANNTQAQVRESLEQALADAAAAAHLALQEQTSGWIDIG